MEQFELIKGQYAAITNPYSHLISIRYKCLKIGVYSAYNQIIMMFN
jgi:hypothetical protein